MRERVEDGINRHRYCTRSVRGGMTKGEEVGAGVVKIVTALRWSVYMGGKDVEENKGQ